MKALQSRRWGQDGVTATLWSRMLESFIYEYPVISDEFHRMRAALKGTSEEKAETTLRNWIEETVLPRFSEKFGAGTSLDALVPPVLLTGLAQRLASRILA